MSLDGIFSSMTVWTSERGSHKNLLQLNRNDEAGFDKTGGKLTVADEGGRASSKPVAFTGDQFFSPTDYSGFRWLVVWVVIHFYGRLIFTIVFLNN